MEVGIEMCKTTLFIVAVLSLPVLAYSATIYVPDDYPAIQQAIDSSANGDTVIVKPGTYVENIDFKGKAITLQSEKGADVTTIDGNKTGSVVTCKSGEGPDTVLDGFTITNGSGSVVDPPFYGGGGM
jgi:nitrous oxidase accessory protein NosD